MMIELKIVIFDEIDLGFDIDVLKVVFKGINKMCSENFGCLMIIYYQCLLNYIILDVVYVMM